MKDKIVTVFGASGFIGTYIVRELCRLGYTVRAVTRNPERAKHLRTMGLVGQVVPIAGDFTKPDTFDALVQNSCAVVNAVGILFESRGTNFNLIHAQSVERLAQAAKKAGAERFVHISAITDENSQAKYARSKIAGEKALAAAFPEAVILQPSVVFGAEDNFFNFFARMSNFLPFLPLIGGGKTRFQPVFVGDVAKAVVNAVENKKLKGSYELGGTEIFTLKQILKKTLKHAGRKRLLVRVPFGAAKIFACITPKSLLTKDQVELLKHDNIMHAQAKKLKDLGIEPTPIDAVLPTYLSRYSRKKAA